MKKSNSCMEGMTKTIGDNQDRICFLESLNRQLKGTVEHKDKQTQEVGNIEWSMKKLFMNLGNGYSKVGGELAHGQAQGPKLFRLDLLRMPQFPLYICKSEVLSHQTSQSSWFSLHKKHVKRSAFQNKQIEV